MQTRTIAAAPPLLLVTALLLAPAVRGGDEAEGPARPVTEADAFAGKAVYLRECSACHGDRGDGNGPAAPFLDPRPRDFTKKRFKLKTTPSGEPPRTGDVLRTIERGIPGTAMPSFAFLTDEERRKCAAFVLNAADLLDDKEPLQVADPGAPPAATPASVARGKVVYERVGCASCHGARGKGDGPSANDQKDDDGRPIEVRDFTTGVFRGGTERPDVYMRIVVGLDGTPMPSFAGTISSVEDRWALVDFVRSLCDSKPAALPAAPIEAGRAVAAKYGCQGCHVLDDGKGGDVGPDLRVSGQKLKREWVRSFLKAPREAGKIYPWRPHRMPGLKLADDEVEAAVKYLGAMGGDKPASPLPDPATFPVARLEEGRALFTLRCTECHNLGKVIEVPLAKQQGPDLIRVAGRVEHDWAKAWILDPKKIDPRTRMTVPGISDEQAESVRMFVWKHAIEADRAGGGK